MAPPYRAVKDCDAIKIWVDALTRALRIYAEAGGIGLFVDALDEQAAGYYRKFGFEASPDNPLLLFLSAKVTE